MIDRHQIAQLSTERRNPATMALDTFTPLQIAQAMNTEDANAVRAVKSVLPDVATAIQWAADSLRAGGRIVYVGAGTSGRLGVLDAVECPPTFGVDPSVVVGLIAGGTDEFVKAREGAEDDEDQGGRDLRGIELADRDFVVGLAASGRTPYVIGALAYARETGCKTASIACTPHSKVGAVAELAIEPVTGPEVLTGSTRLKAGTAQKLILNMISTGAMTLTGKVYQNLMVDVKQTNEKLRARALNIVTAACDCDEDRAANALAEADGNVKVAITSILLDTDASQAERALEQAGGHVRDALSRISRS